MRKVNKMLFSSEALDTIANKVHAKIDYQKITKKVLEELPALIEKTIEADLDDIVKSLPKSQDGKDGKDGQDGKEGLSHQEKKQIRADVTRDIQKNIKMPTLDEIAESLAGSFVTKGLLKNRMEALTRFIKQKTPVSAGISGGDMVDEITKVLGQDWQSGGAVESVDGRVGIVTLGDLYEPVISKNTAFNKNFGAGAGQVAEGNALAAKMTGPGSSLINQLFTAIDINGNAKVVPVTIDPVTLRMSGLKHLELVFNLVLGSANTIAWREGGLESGAIVGDMFINNGGLFKLRHTAAQLTSIEASHVQLKVVPEVESTSLIIGAFIVNGGAVIAKNLRVGGNQFIYIVKSGATQGAAGAAIHEVWQTSGHATLPDNVLMMGV